MVAMSRQVLRRALDDYPCSYLVHPDEPICSRACFKLALSCWKGSAKYFLLMYAAQYAIKYKTLTLEDVPSILKSYCRSVLLGIWCPCAITGTICLWKNVTGRFDKEVVCYVAGLVGGCGVYLDNAKRRPIVSYTISALAMEALIRRLYGKINRPFKTETITFMIMNGILMYKMRTTELASFSRDIWFFRPPKIRRSNKIDLNADDRIGGTLNKACPHSGSCRNDIIKGVSKYILGTTIFTATRILILNPKLRRNPIKFLKTLFEWDNMRLTTFFGWYVGAYKMLSCFLCRIGERDRPEYAIAAGFIAGLSYGVNRNITVLGSLILYVARIYGREVQEKYQLPRIHFMELSMIISFAVLINSRVLDHKNCPRGFEFMLKTVTQDRFTALFDQIIRILEEEKRSEQINAT
ncbi:Hypothetical protein NTJ_04764 [Nesidiocoris tenuis]|uniref:Transmembrane protein 135 N-terminal domain-containing protein n=1 Tax=Nesidiocoris tenuis TaxID=355587 RepID=A0ABN7AI75_9HEMI|nr:Hypothetical protein NTJ_04764 [Nesidiocoris tenuis]